MGTLISMPMRYWVLRELINENWVCWEFTKSAYAGSQVATDMSKTKHFKKSQILGQIKPNHEKHMSGNIATHTLVAVTHRTLIKTITNKFQWLQVLLSKFWTFVSGLFVVVSWISFVVPPDVIPGRMALLITLFLVLVNIFNSVTTNTPKAEGKLFNYKDFSSETFFDTSPWKIIDIVFDLLLGKNTRLKA